MWGSSTDPGDWVKAKETIPVTASDHLLGTGIPPGTKGVVVGRYGPILDVEFDGGDGITRTRVKSSKCSIVRYQGGRNKFLRRASTIRTARIALALFLLWPLIQFAAIYWWEYRTLDGIIATAVVASLESLGDLILATIQDPIRVVIYAVFIAILTKIAFKH